MKIIFAVILLFIISTSAKSQNVENSHIVLKGDLAFLETEFDSVDFHSYIVDSSNQVISYFLTCELNDYEIYHHFELFSSISSYGLVISGDEENKGGIEYYLPLSFEPRSIEIKPGLALNLTSIKPLNKNEFRKHIKQEPRLRSSFDPNRHNFE